MSTLRRFEGCFDGICDGPRANALPTCSACLAADCETAIDACGSEPKCTRALAELRRCTAKVGANEHGRTGCWDNFQVNGGLAAEPSLRTCATIRCPSCEGPAK